MVVKDFKCKVCEKVFKNSRAFSSHLHRGHGINVQEYYIEYMCNGIKPTCLCGCGGLTTWSPTTFSFRRYLAGHNIRVDGSGNKFTSENQPEMSQEQIDKRNNAIRSAYSGNSGEQIKEKISGAVNKIMQTDEWKQNHSNGLKEKWQDPDFIAKQHASRNTEEYKELHRQKAYRQLEEGNWGVATYTEDSYRKLRDHAIKLLEQGKIGPQAPYKTEWKHNPFTDKDEYMHSSWESQFLDMCIELNIPVTKDHNIRIDWQSSDKNFHSYIPDFLGIENNIIYEIKPDYFQDNDENVILKMEAAEKWAFENGYQYIILSLNQFSDALSL